MWKFCAAALVAAVMSTVGAGTCQATVTFELDTIYTGATPTGSGPWLTMTFENIVGGDVLLTLTANLQAASEFFDTIGFNFDGPTGLTASAPDAGEFYTFGAAAANLGGGGVAAFDIGFDLPNNNSGGGVQRFKGNETMTIVFSADAAINETMFNVTNATGQFAGAHVNGIPGGLSGKITTDDGPPDGEEPPPVVPEPGTLVLMALGGAGLAAFRRRRKTVEA